MFKMKIEKKVGCISAFCDIDLKQYPYPMWVLGNAFICRHYLEFDMGNDRIGFARTKRDFSQK